MAKGKAGLEARWGSACFRIWGEFGGWVRAEIGELECCEDEGGRRRQM